jgi:hypothetical protein
MSLYHGFDMPYRKLQESWKKIQEDDYTDASKNKKDKQLPDVEGGYTERKGLEGPFHMHNGKTYYYDPKEGKYYDPTTDWYVDHDSEEFYQLTGMKKMSDFYNENLKEVEEVEETMDSIAQQIKANINTPFIKVSPSPLGGGYSIHISLDPRESWSNNIFHNSKYLIFMVNKSDKSLELLSKHYGIPVKFRKTRVRNTQQVIEKLKDYLNQIKEV